MVIGVFAFFLGLIGFRLFYLQVIKAGHYEQEISKIHYKESTLDAQRGHIFAMDKTGKPIQLTENIGVYDIYLEPHHLENNNNKQKFIDIIAPALYKHFCVQQVAQESSSMNCLERIQAFTDKNLIPEKPEFFYLGSGVLSEGYDTYDLSGYNAKLDSVVEGMTEEVWLKLIKERLDQKIVIWLKQYNYLWFFEHPTMLDQLAKLQWVKTFENYVYIEPAVVSNKSQIASTINRIFDQYWFKDMKWRIDDQMKQKENTYIKIASGLHPSIAAELIETKKKYRDGFSSCFKYYIQNNSTEGDCETYRWDWNDIGESKSLLHGLGLEEYFIRHYPYDNFLSHVLGYVNKDGVATYGVEEYLNKELEGKDGKIIGRSSSFIGDLGANEFAIDKAQDGNDIYLTIDPTIQKELTKIAQGYKDQFFADSVSITVMNPFNGQVAALVNAPNFNPNQFNDAYEYTPLTPEFAYILDHESYVDVHVYIRKEDGSYRKATTSERQDPTIEKYMTKNVYSAEIFVDKNIKYAYEPGSIFKWLTVAVGIDTDEINLFDFYDDKWFVKIGQYTIENIADNCLGENSFLNALIYSCNVWMVRIVQAVGKEIFYNYLKKLGFGQKTGIELAGEEEGFVGHSTTVSVARFLNNSFGLGMRATPVQIATAYSTLLNDGYLVKPTVVAKRYNKIDEKETENNVTIVRRVFKESTAKELQNALFDVVHQNKQNKEYTALEGFTLGGKSGTSEIAYKGKYLWTAGWTNASFVGIITQENPKYVIVVQVRRPRTNKRWVETAGQVFKSVAEFIIGYELIAE